MPTLILIAYHFPPDTAIGAARPYRFFKYLQRLGYTVHVITASPQRAGHGATSDWNVQYIPDPFFLPTRGVFWQLERALRKFLLPGVLGMRWASAVVRAAQNYLPHQSGPVTVLSTSPPFGTHYAAWKLVRAERLPWIADFRDPFGGVSLEMEGLNSLHKALFNWLEKRVMQAADSIIANTDSMQQVWKRQYQAQAGKMHLLWNGFDPESLISPLPIPQRPYRELSHVGELYAGRTVAPVLESFSRLIASGAIAAAALKVRIIGPAKTSALPSPEFLEHSRQQGWLELSTDAVSQQEARRIAQTSDGLLLIQPQSAVQVPGKLYEYLQIGRPILAFVMRDSPVERILSQAGVPYRCVYVNSSAAEMDSAVADFLTLPSDAVTASDWFQQNFRAEHQAEALAGLVQSLRA